MAVRQVIKIDQDKCIGCGLCASACHEGAIGIIDGKATLLRDDYCDGLGNCLPHCPTEAISFEQREATPYNKEIAPKRVAEKEATKSSRGGGCAGSLAKSLVSSSRPKQASGGGCPGSMAKKIESFQPGNRALEEESTGSMQSQLGQWPVQIKLVPVNAPYFDGAKLLIAADCTAYAYANFHQDFIKGRITLVGCPKLDAVDYSDKLTEILKHNDIRSITVVRMEVPCCGGIEQAVKKALLNSGKLIPWDVVIVSTDGRILDRV